MPPAPRKGITANYYDCLRACRGKYIADCSGDDRWPDEPRLAAHVALLEEQPELSAVAGDWIENGAVREATDRPGAADFIGALAGLPVVLSAATFRAVAVRGHIESIVREDYPCEDLPLFMAIAFGSGQYFSSNFQSPCTVQWKKSMTIWSILMPSF